MEEYLTKLLEQVRCKKAHEAIRQEIRLHMEEQISDNIQAGMTHDEAEKAAVLDMGSPIEAGISLDKIHRPKTAWQMIVLMGVITLFSMAVHWQIGKPIVCAQFFWGFLFMIFIYHLDYTTIASFAKPLAAVFYFLCIFSLLSNTTVNGRFVYLSFPFIGSVSFSLFSFLMLFVPIYGALLYQYYGMGYLGLLKAMLWAFPAIAIALFMPSLTLALILSISMAALLMLAVWKGWFAVNRKKTLAVFLACGTAVLAVSIFCGIYFGTMAQYQIARLQNFFSSNHTEFNYVAQTLNGYFQNSQFFGTSALGIAETLPDYDNSFILAYLTATYGYIACIAVCVILAVLVYKSFAICFRQKNQLGMIMGCASGIILFLNGLINILENFGFLPVTQTFLPFFSQGGSCTIICYIFMGIILSVYRYKDIYTSRRHTTLKKFPKIKILLE